MSKPSLATILKRRRRTAEQYLKEQNPIASREDALKFIESLKAFYTLEDSFVEELLAHFPEEIEEEVPAESIEVPEELEPTAEPKEIKKSGGRKKS